MTGDSPELAAAKATLSDLVDRRRPFNTGGNPHTFLELHGARMVEVTAFEPDPTTYRCEYYYHATLNRLYRRVVTHRRDDGVIKAQWIPASS